MLAAAGLARPQRFFAMLRDMGIDAEELALDDHHDFATLPWPRDTGDVIVTEKDAVKLAPSRAIAGRVWVAALDFEPAATFADASSRSFLRLEPAPAAPRKHLRRMKTACLNCSLPALQGASAALSPAAHALQELVCRADGLAFPVRDGIPVMLEGEARSLGDETGPGAAPTAPS